MKKIVILLVLIMSLITIVACADNNEINITSSYADQNEVTTLSE